MSAKIKSFLHSSLDKDEMEKYDWETLPASCSRIIQLNLLFTIEVF